MALPTLSQLARPHLPGPDFLSFLARFRNEPIAVLHSGHRQGFSVLARRPLLTLRVAGESSPPVLEISRDFTWEGPLMRNLPTDPLDAWDAVLSQASIHSPHHQLTGWIGYLSYDIARAIEQIGNSATNDLHTPLLHWRLFQQYYLYDHANRQWTAVVTTFGDKQPERLLNEMQEEFAAAAESGLPVPPRGELVEQMPREEYLSTVRRIKEYIAAGDIFQANFAQRWKVQTRAEPIDIFRRLMSASPAAYAALLVEGDRAVISASPELLLHRIGNELFTCPIKGTRPRDLADPAHDAQLREELLHSEKDKAELAMIVDLLRNDLGRVAEYGSVQVVAPREIEQLPTLWHAVAGIRAALRDASAAPQSWAPLLRAIMPGGSITGAPKIRAMQIIEELEGTRRGTYCGAVGCVNTQADATPVGTFNIAIRTIQMIGDTAYLHAGGGIVADSDPEAEYDETLHKAAALFRALHVEPVKS